MEPKIHSQFFLGSGIRFSTCVAPHDNCAGKAVETGKDRTGDLVVSLNNKGIPIEATFYSPDRPTCREGNCDLKVLFKGEDLSALINEDYQLRNEYSMSTPTKSTVSKSSEPRGAESGGSARHLLSPLPSPDPNSNSLLSSIPSLLPIVFFGLAGVALIYIIYKSSAKFLGHGGTVQYRDSTLTRPTRSSFTPSRASTAAPPQARSASSEDIRQHLLPVIDKLNSISSRLSQVETDVFALTQQIQSPTPKVFSSSAINNLDIPSNQYIPPPPPSAPLSIELIREAVLTNNYSLIASYPHHFVSETPESRQGLEDAKRFAIEGDQSQASGRTQSEFIVVPFSTELYLIPNILPNAADPARTIKRHADKNNIYRNGQGANLLNLISLAVVRRNGDRYDLASTGQIA